MPRTRPALWETAIALRGDQGVVEHHIARVHAPVRGEGCWSARVEMPQRWETPFDRPIHGVSAAQAMRLAMAFVRIVYEPLLLASNARGRLVWRPVSVRA